jgi:hypothetical protein
MSDLHKLREETITSSSPDENIDDTNNNDNNNTIDTIAQDPSPDELRRRHIRRNRLNDSYDLLEQDLAHLREAVDEVATLVAQQQEKISNTAHVINMAQYRIHHASSFLQKAVHHRYVTLATGAVLGACIGGPVGFVMGTKIGSLVALSGSAVGALSMNIMRQRATPTDESEDTVTAYHQAML